jgi:hypothetical protein
MLPTPCLAQVKFLPEEYKPPKEAASVSNLGGKVVT